MSLTPRIRLQQCSNLRAIYLVGLMVLPPLLFKRLRHCLAEPLALLFSQLFSVSSVPSDWKRGVIIPVFKRAQQAMFVTTLTCVPSKIMERIIAGQMYTHFKANGILHSAQHGFCKGRSTCSNLLESFNDWTLSIYRTNIMLLYLHRL